MKRRFHWLPSAPSKTALFIIISAFALALLSLTTLGRRKTVHVFELQSAPASLSESLAIEMGKNALRADGLDPREWGLLPALPLKPDGRFFDQMTPNRGSLTFTNAGQLPRWIVISLTNQEIRCVTWYGGK